MRRSDREVKGFAEITAIMQKCDVCRIALNNGDYPYILPLNFGLKITGERVELYFHGAEEGTKYDLIAKDPRAGFEMDCAHRLVSDSESGSCTMEYMSVVGRGRIEILPESEKREALGILMSHYHGSDFKLNEAAIPKTKVFKLTVEEMTGKKRIKGARS